MATIARQKYILNINNTYWRVKIRINQTETKNKCFAFAKYGGQKHALNAAIEWRNRMLERYKLTERLNYKKSPDYFKTQPKSPIIGVYKNYNPSTKAYNWIVRYSVNGKEKKQTFSCNLYGDCEAFRMACAIRFAKAGRLVITNKELMPCELLTHKKTALRRYRLKI